MILDKKLVAVVVASSMLTLGGCSNMGPRQQAGAALGAVGGAIVGAQLGGAGGSLAGAGIGAAAGGIVGSAIGKSMDDSASKRRRARH